MVSLSDIFKQAGKVKEVTIESDTFSHSFHETFGITHIAGEQALYCIMSLSCTHCIEVLPELAAIQHNKFFLITDGDIQDNEEIKHELKFTFPLFSYNKPLDRVNINKTPTSLVVDKNGDIIENIYTPKLTDILEILDRL
jgi:hypothetical protein